MLYGRISKAQLNAVRKLKNKPTWKSTFVAILTYRRALLLAQGFKCAYCRRTIYRDEVGFRELDHVLPKSRAPKDDSEFAAAPISSNVLGDRRHTRGYPSFRYEPENLVVSCKRCNSFKGSFDGLADRAQEPALYPSTSNEYEWIHPFWDPYDAHIRVSSGYVYKALAKSKKGVAVIHACGLDKAEELSARAADSFIHPYEDLLKAMIAAAVSPDVEQIDPDKLAEGLYKKHQVRYRMLTEKLVLDCLKLLLKTAVEDIVHIGDAVNDAGVKLAGAVKLP